MSSRHRLLRLPAVLDITGHRTTNLYKHCKLGLFPAPIKITQRSVAWPESEVVAVNAARIAGRSDDEIRRLVADLMAARTRALPLATAPGGDTVAA